VEVLDLAEKQLADAPPGVAKALAELRELATAMQELYPEVNLYLDLSELRGYHYHTGLVFAAYVPLFGQALAKGGRYDEIGGVFGRARPATGFSTDLKILAALAQPGTKAALLAAPAACQRDSQGRELLKQLRAEGKRVVFDLQGADKPAGVSGRIEYQQGRWQVTAG